MSILLNDMLKEERRRNAGLEARLAEDRRRFEEAVERREEAAARHWEQQRLEDRRFFMQLLSRMSGRPEVMGDDPTS